MAQGFNDALIEDYDAKDPTAEQPVFICKPAGTGCAGNDAEPKPITGTPMACDEFTREDLQEFFPDHPDAVTLLADVWDVMQAWDDAYDGDPADHHDGYLKAVVKLPENPLYHPLLMPLLIAQCYYDWMTANEFEQNNEHLDKAYILRAGYFRIVITAIHLLYGSESAEREAPVIWRMYTEDFTQYRQEIQSHAKDRKKQSRQGTEAGRTGTN